MDVLTCQVSSLSVTVLRSIRSLPRVSDVNYIRIHIICRWSGPDVSTVSGCNLRSLPCKETSTKVESIVGRDDRSDVSTSVVEFLAVRGETYNEPRFPAPV